MTQGPSLNWVYNWAQDGYALQPAGSLHIYDGLPLGVSLRGGDAWVATCDGMQVTDSFGQPTYLVEEWIDA